MRRAKFLLLQIYKRIDLGVFAKKKRKTEGLLASVTKR